MWLTVKFRLLLRAVRVMMLRGLWCRGTLLLRWSSPCLSWASHG
nr:MAG TPA: hypothetical protein [Caudoviricetes sp.]